MLFLLIFDNVSFVKVHFTRSEDVDEIFRAREGLLLIKIDVPKDYIYKKDVFHLGMSFFDQLPVLEGYTVFSCNLETFLSGWDLSFLDTSIFHQELPPRVFTCNRHRQESSYKVNSKQAV